MNPSQIRIVKRFLISAVGLLTGFIILFFYLINHTIGNYFEVFLGITTLYLILVSILWFREKSLYEDYLMARRIQAGQVEYMLCPTCKSIQLKGMRKCRTCGEKWIACKVCQIPFEPRSSVLVSPCCGQGFHVEHFEVALRELSHCPHCKSDLALKTSNW